MEQITPQFERRLRAFLSRPVPSTPEGHALLAALAERAEMRGFDKDVWAACGNGDRVVVGRDGPVWYLIRRISADDERQYEGTLGGIEAATATVSKLMNGRPIRWHATALQLPKKRSVKIPSSPPLPPTPLTEEQLRAIITPSARPVSLAAVLHARYCTAEPPTLRALGVTLGVTGNRVGQVEARGLRMLRHPFRRAALLPHDGTRLFMAVFGVPSPDSRPSVTASAGDPGQ